jgi:hypothetical protein
VTKPRKRFEVVPLSQVLENVNFVPAEKNAKKKATPLVEPLERKLILERDAADISERVFCGSRHKWSE